MINTNSDVTLVVTSCGRFDLLKATLESFTQCCDYPIKQLILTEDSGNEAVHDVIPKALQDNALVFVNNPKLGQVRSIDLAYSHVSTPYIMHCEDDWQFFRPGFLHESKRILEDDENILLVRLNNHQYKNTNLIGLNDRKLVDNIPYYTLTGRCRGLTWNPGLRRLIDYHDLQDYQSLSKKHDTFLDVEYAANQFYMKTGKEAVMLENFAVMHIGDGHHVLMHGEKRKKWLKRLRRVTRVFAVFALGIATGYFLSCA